MTRLEQGWAETRPRLPHSDAMPARLPVALTQVLGGAGVGGVSQPTMPEPALPPLPAVACPPPPLPAAGPAPALPPTPVPPDPAPPALEPALPAPAPPLPCPALGGAAFWLAPSPQPSSAPV